MSAGLMASRMVSFTAAGGRPRFGPSRLYRDAGSVATSTAVNAALGLAFWGIAAKLFPPAELGVMTAVLAVIVSVSLVVAAGIGDAYTALLPAVGTARSSVYRQGQRLFRGITVVVALAGAVLTAAALPEVRGSVAVAALVFVGIVALSTLTLQNATLVALGRARWLPLVNIAVSVGKIVLLVVLTITVRRHAVELAVTLTALLAVLVLRPRIVRVIETDDDLPPSVLADQPRPGAFTSFVMQTLASSTLSLGLITLTPFLVTAFAGPSQGALFALSLSVAQGLDFAGSALAVSLSVHASSHPGEAVKMAHAILIRALLLVTAGSLVLIVLLSTAFRALDASYPAMGADAVITVMCAGSVVRTVYLVWASLQRSRRRMKVPLALNLISGVLLLALLPAACAARGALGGAVALLIASAVLSGGAAVHHVVGLRQARAVADGPA